MATTKAKPRQIKGGTWEEIGRTTLGSAGDAVTVSSLPPRKYLKIVFYSLGVNAATTILRINGNSGNNYASRVSVNGGADSTATAASSIPLSTNDNNNMYYAEFDIINIATREKFIHGFFLGSAAGASAAPFRIEVTGKYVDITNAITSVSLLQTTTGDFGIGSELIVYGRD